MEARATRRELSERRDMLGSRSAHAVRVPAKSGTPHGKFCLALRHSLTALPKIKSRDYQSLIKVRQSLIKDRQSLIRDC